MESETRYVHHGKGTVRPYIYGRLDLLDFVKKVFNAVELERNNLPSGFHVQAQIGDSVMVLSAMDPPYQEATRGSVYVYVPDVDATYQRALAAGATSVTQPADKPWKGRAAGVKDSFAATSGTSRPTKADWHPRGTLLEMPLVEPSTNSLKSSKSPT